MAIEPKLLDELLDATKQSGSIDLDRFAEVIAPYDLDADAIDELLGALEARGRSVEGDASASPKDELRQVLAAARRFVADHRRKPSPRDIAELSGLDVAVVRRALIYGRVLAR